MKKNKLKVGLFSLTGCEGCYFALIDKAVEFLHLSQEVVIKRFCLFEESEIPDNEFYDLAFVEGSPLTTANFEFLQDLRMRSELLVALGSCADMGGICHLKNYGDKEKMHDFVYGAKNKHENFSVLPLREVVKIDFNIPGCPINAEEFIRFVRQVIIGNPQKVWSENPVCIECSAHGYECQLQKGKICLGPITVGGCDAVCLKSKQGCYGCRGLLEDAEVGNLVKVLRENNSDRAISEVLEIFGIKESINESNKHENS
ncbi:MAG: NADH:ubiquinone oxidoreductase [Patescibacteria group bacterium]